MLLPMWLRQQCIFGITQKLFLVWRAAACWGKILFYVDNSLLCVFLCLDDKWISLLSLLEVFTEDSATPMLLNIQLSPAFYATVMILRLQEAHGGIPAAVAASGGWRFRQHRSHRHPLHGHSWFWPSQKTCTGGWCLQSLCRQHHPSRSDQYLHTENHSVGDFSGWTFKLRHETLPKESDQSKLLGTCSPLGAWLHITPVSAATTLCA